MNRFFGFVLGMLVLQSVLSQEVPGGNLRAVHSQLEHSLTESLENLHGVISDAVQNDNARALADDASVAAVTGKQVSGKRVTVLCAAIQAAFMGKVSCDCKRQLLKTKVQFTCTSVANLTLADGFSGVPQYTGTVDLNPLKLNTKLDGKVCVLQGVLFGQNVQDFCVGGGLCVGLTGVKLGAKLCSCLVTYGDRGCACTECALGLTFQCEQIPLPQICVPLPFIQSTDPPPNSIPVIGA